MAAAETASLDDPQSFEPASSYQVRGELQQLVRRDLLGPWDGEEEQLASRGMGPRERYLVGMLGPKQARAASSAGASLPETDATASGDLQDADLPDVVTPQALGRMWASSMGLSCAVSATGEDAAQELLVVAEWGEYSKRESALSAEEKTGKEPEAGKVAERRSRVWTREQRRFEKRIRLDGRPSEKIPLLGENPELPGVHLRVEVRPWDGSRVVELALVNALDEPETNTDVAWLFQTKLTVTAVDGAGPVFLPIDDPLDDPRGIENDPEEAHLRLLYRNQRRYAAGRNVAVHATFAEGERRAIRLETEWVPAYDVPETIAPVGEGTPLAGVLLSMDELATADPRRLGTGLAPLADGYRLWLDEQERQIATLPEPLRPAAVAAVHRARHAADRIAAGIALVSDPSSSGHVDALTAFRFANRAMADQRRRTAIARLRVDRGLTLAQAEEEVERQGASAASWRPFQLAFVLLNLPSLTDPAHPERAADSSATVDLLFFPTGGGKTEAYLGLTAYAFAIRRLQGTVGFGDDSRDGRAGVAVLMRYTLRLLTAQQFQRAAALVCAAELIRRDDPGTWGEEPFRIGLWVGGKVSPNWFPDAARQIGDARQSGDDRRVNVLQTLSCPWCGEPLLGYRNVKPSEDERRIRVFCGNAEGAGACPFSEPRSTDGEGLPILTVDEEIYRLAPSLVIATVDKLAQLPWKGYSGILFGQVRQRCTRHGYRHPDLDQKTGCVTFKHNAKGSLPGAKTVEAMRLRPPDLIIQDELHLISGALGTTVGLFEAAVDELCTWRVRVPGSGEPRLTGPKIVASTATTRRAAEQVLGVFGRDLAIFPPQVIGIEKTFFSEQLPVTPEHPGRRYVGLCAHGVRLKSAQIRLAEILLLAGQTLLDRCGTAADPYATLVAYFNATRELAGMRRYLDDDVATRVRTHGRVRQLSNRLLRRADLLTIQELTSRISSGDISDALSRLEERFDPDLDTTARKLAIRENVGAVLEERKSSRAKKDPSALAFHPTAERFQERRRADRAPVDVVLATSMLQVGVDVSRFGLMVVTGQPKNTAEYIQASSRVGRDPARPGLVITLYNWSRPRDLAHFEDFEHYHATFYRQVEALSVTPYTRRAIDRGAAATVVAAVRNLAYAHSPNVAAHDVPLTDSPVEAALQRMLTRAEAVRGQRGRSYLEEQIRAIVDRWQQGTTAQARLGYETTTGQQPTRGLLARVGSPRPNTLAIGMSMRETEEEINLLVPGGGKIYDPVFDPPAWTFRAPGERDEEDDEPQGDELGVSQLTGTPPHAGGDQ
jgi:hypothetical protein